MKFESYKCPKAGRRARIEETEKHNMGAQDFKERVDRQNSVGNLNAGVRNSVAHVSPIYNRGFVERVSVHYAGPFADEE